MERFSKSLVVSKMEIKTTMSYHYKPNRKAKNKTKQTLTVPSGAPGMLRPSWLEHRVVRALREQVWQCFTKLNIPPPRTQKSHCKRNENICLHKTCTQTFMTVLFIVLPKRTLICPWTGVWVNRLWAVHRWNITLPWSEQGVHETAALNLKVVMLNDSVYIMLWKWQQ